MSARHTLVALCSSLALLVSGLFTPAWGTAAWTPPEQIDPQARAFQIAVSENGDAIAVWSAGNNEVSAIMSSFRRAGGNWSSPAAVSDPNSESFTNRQPMVLMDRFGNATVAWWSGEYNPYDMTSPAGGSLSVAYRPTRGRWSAPRRFGSNLSSVRTVMAADSRGNVTVAWMEDGVSSIRRSPDSDWTGPAVFTEGHSPALAAAAGEPITMVWATREGLKSATRRSNGRWRGLGIIAAASTRSRINSLDLAADAQGNLVLVVGGKNFPASGNPCSLRTFIKRRGASWKPSEVLHQLASDDGCYGRASTLTSGGDTTTVAWSQDDGDSGPRVVARSWAPGKSWTSPQEIAGSAVDGLPALTTGASGRPLAVWRAGGTRTGYSIRSAHRTPRGSWTRPVTVARRDGNRVSEYPATAGPVVAAYPNGMFTAVFVRNLDRYGVEFSDLVDDSRPPYARMVKPRGDTSARLRIPVSWIASDSLSRVRDMDIRLRTYLRRSSETTVWRRNTPRYAGMLKAREGRSYCLAVRATDRVGNTSRWSRSRCVATPHDDRSLRASQAWRRIDARGSYRATLSTTRRRGSRLVRRALPARELSLVARTCPECGTVRVTHGARNLGTYDLTSGRARNRRIIRLRTYRGHEQGGRLVIRVVSSGKPVQIDGVVARRGPR